MKLWAAYCHDRHIDPVIRVFEYREAAIAFAREYMHEHVAHPEELREEEAEGVFYIDYVVAEDQAFVMETDLNDDAID